MKKSVFCIAVLMIFAMMNAGPAIADNTFDAPKGSRIEATVVGDKAIISWSGIDVAYVEQYRFANAVAVPIGQYKPDGNRVSFNPYEGDQFQIVNTQGQYLFLSPELMVAKYAPITLSGVEINCQPGRDCFLQLK